MELNTCSDCGTIINNSFDTLCERCNNNYETREDLKLLNTTKFELKAYLKDNSLNSKERYQATKDLNITVIDMPTIKPLDKEIIKKYAKSNIFTVEDHSIIGGLGSSVAEVIAEEGIHGKLCRIGVNDIFPESGAPADLYEKYGLSSNKIKEKILNELDK